MFQRSAGESRQDEGLFGSEVVEDPEDLNVEFFYAIAGKNRTTRTAHPGPDILQRKEGDLGERGQRCGERDQSREVGAKHILIVIGEGRRKNFGEIGAID